MPSQFSDSVGHRAGSARTEVKICGVKTSAAMDAAVNAGADFVGLVFYQRSPRNVDIKTAVNLAERARGRCRIVALVVDPTDDELDDIVRELRPDVIQLHGQESLTRVAEIRARYGREVWKAIAIETVEDVLAAEPYTIVAHRVLFDAKPPKGAALPGGNGEPFDWSVLDGVAARHPFILSGGLTPNTVADAIARTYAAAVDVSSGVETTPGEKDAGLINRFIQAAKASTLVS